MDRLIRLLLALSTIMFTPYNITGLSTVNVNTPLFRIFSTDSLCSALRSTLIRFERDILPREWCEILLGSLFALGTVENFRSWGTETEVNCLNTSIISSLDKISEGITTSENSWGDIRENLIFLTRCSPSKDLLLEPLTTMFSSSHRLWAHLSTALKSDTSWSMRNEDRSTKRSKRSCSSSRNEALKTISLAL